MRTKKNNDPRETSQVGPRQLKDKKSPEYAWQTIALMRTYFQSKEVSEKRWEGILEEAERDRIYERVPPEKPYGSLDALLKAELGVDKKESIEAKKLGKHGTNQHTNKGQEIGVANGISNIGSNNSEYLSARIARDRPDILNRMKAGEFPSVRQAAIAAGIVKQRSWFEQAQWIVANRLTPKEQEAFQIWMNERGVVTDA